MRRIWDETLSDRLLRKSTQLKNGCRQWTGGLDQDGYGHLVHKNRINIRAHRAAWEVWCGTIPSGMHVLHKCNNRKCINTKHLYLGTNKENKQDSIEAGTIASGQRNGSAKLTNAAVAKIKRALVKANGRYGSSRKLALQYGVGDSTIWRIRYGYGWK
jgi:hypothetical protein